MLAAIKIFSGGKPGATWWRRLLAAVGTVAVIGTGTAAVASPAYADYTEQTCGTYHSWTVCLSYDFTNGNLAVNALNGYSTTQVEALWISINGKTVDNQGFSIPPHSWRGYAYFVGTQSVSACAGINNIKIVCGNFN